jgi:choline dehydrogenase-like flavoprotein
MPHKQPLIVNVQLVFHSVSNLRILNASIFPVILRGNVHFSVFAMAERAADIIRGDEDAKKTTAKFEGKKDRGCSQDVKQ